MHISGDTETTALTWQNVSCATSALGVGLHSHHPRALEGWPRACRVARSLGILDSGWRARAKEVSCCRVFGEEGGGSV